MKPEEIDLIKYRLQKAHNTLEDARHYYGSVTPASTVNRIYYQAVEKHPSAALRSSFVIAAYCNIRLIPRDFARLASECF